MYIVIVSFLTNDLKCYETTLPFHPDLRILEVYKNCVEYLPFCRVTKHPRSSDHKDKLSDFCIPSQISKTKVAYMWNNLCWKLTGPFIF